MLFQGERETLGKDGGFEQGKEGCVEARGKGMRPLLTISIPRACFFLCARSGFSYSGEPCGGGEATWRMR